MWRTNTKTNGKLSFLYEFKKWFGFESYLDKVPIGNRHAMTKLRLSNHRFPIEEMRMVKEIPRKERICKICSCKEIGDEWHYLKDCKNKKIETARKSFIANMKQKFPMLSSFHDETLMKYSMNMKDENMQNDTAHFVKQLLKAYNEEIETLEDKRAEKICSIM